MRSAPGDKAVRLSNPDGGLATATIHYTRDCPTEGVFGTGDQCNACPAGATCPGGNRVWPQAGYWNAGEESGYVRGRL